MQFLICPGAQKAGTTTLFDILASHPALGTASKKETKYFLRSIRDISKEEYINLYFKEKLNREYLIDIDPEFLYYPDTAEKIFKTLGSNVKFIFLLRNPVERAYSHYWMSYRRGFDVMSFPEAVKMEKKRLEKADKMAIWHWSYLDRGYYYRQIKNYLKYFPIENMMFIIFEEFIGNQKEVLKRISKFLKVNDNVFDEMDLNIKSNEGGLPKSGLLSKLQGQPMLLKDIIKILVPFRKLRWKIHPLIEKYNRSTKKIPRLEEDIKKQLMELFKDDIINLEERLKINTELWFRDIHEHKQFTNKK